MATPQKIVIALVGPKGSGKSTIGSLIVGELEIHFLRVEPLFLQVRARLGEHSDLFEQQGFELVRSTIVSLLSEHDLVCFESTGASRYFSVLLSQLGQLASVLLVRVTARADLCALRVRSRDSSIHIPVSDDRVEQINALAFEVSLPWSAEIDNSSPFNPAEVLAIFRGLLLHNEQPVA